MKGAGFSISSIFGFNFRFLLSVCSADLKYQVRKENSISKGRLQFIAQASVFFYDGIKDIN